MCCVAVLLTRIANSVALSPIWADRRARYSSQLAWLSGSHVTSSSAPTSWRQMLHATPLEVRREAMIAAVQHAVRYWTRPFSRASVPIGS